MRHWRYMSIVCMTVLTVAGGVGAADYETPKNQSVKDALPAAVAAEGLAPGAAWDRV